MSKEGCLDQGGRGDKVRSGEILEVFFSFLTFLSDYSIIDQIFGHLIIDCLNLFPIIFFYFFLF